MIYVYHSAIIAELIVPDDEYLWEKQKEEVEVLLEYLWRFTWR